MNLNQRKETWKSDGLEQKELEKLMKSGKITNDKPSDVQKKYNDLFGKFSPSVFRTHFSWTKRNLGKLEEFKTGDISEIFVGNNEKKDIVYDDGKNPSKFERPPIIINSYKDPDSKIEKCVVVSAMFAGSSNFNFDISADGMRLQLNFEWPKPMFNINEIFKAFPMEIPNYHPRYLALENALEEVRSNVEETPIGCIKIRLPIPVQNDSSTWTKKLINVDGCTMIYLELSGFPTNYSIKKEDKYFK